VRSYGLLMAMHRAFPGPKEAEAMETEALAMCVLDRLICTPEDRWSELGFRDGFIKHHVTHAFQTHMREMRRTGVIVTHSGDARMALPGFAESLLEAWAYLEREGLLISEDRRRRVLVTRAGRSRNATYRAGRTHPEAQQRASASTGVASEDSDRTPSAIVLWAHGDAAWSGEQRADWRDSVLKLTHRLLENGINADIDLFHGHETTDWSRFGPSRIKSSRWVIVAVSDTWRRAFEGENEPTANAGAVGEANTLRGMFASDQSDFKRRVVLVLLPGRQRSEVPGELLATTPWVALRDLSDAGLEELLRILLGRPAYPKPAVGRAPALVPRSLPNDDVVTEAETPREAERRAVDPPRLEPADYSTGTFNLHLPAGPLNAHMINQGGSTAEIAQARLSTFLGEFAGEMWVEQAAPLAPERGPSAELPRSGKLTICFGDGELEALLQSPEPLTLSVQYRAAGRPELYEYSVKLHRAAAQPNARPQWRAKSSRVVVIG
jgi:hypothetical protein